MGPLRDVIARFSVAVDDSPLASLDRKIDNLKGNYGALAFVATSALASMATASYHFIQAASDVSETQNKITALFGKDTQAQIVSWSKTVEKEMGRSEYAFQKSFSDFAAFLDPMNIGIDKTVEFSKNLSKLSVDLASFYNTSEKEAQMRLFSGISGETEAVRRLGIDISDTSLAELYNSNENPLDPQHRPGQGGGGRNKGKGLASLTLAQKTQLRYYKIMKDTAKAQGDAARTAGGWANTLKRLTDRFGKLSVAIGKMVEGPGTRFLNLLEGLVTHADFFVTKTRGMETAIALLGYTAVAWTLRWAAANGALVKSFMAMIGKLSVVTAAFLIIEDFWTFITDERDLDKTAIGKMIKMLEDIARPAQAARDALADLKDMMIGSIFGTPQDLLAGVKVVGKDGKQINVAQADNSMQGRINRHAAERRALREKAVANDDMQGYVDARRTDQEVGDSEADFRKDRAKWAEGKSFEQLTEEDAKAGYGWTRAPNTAGGGTVIQVPEININLDLKDLPHVDVGQIQVIAREAGKQGAREGVQAAAATLRRRKGKQ